MDHSGEDCAVPPARARRRLEWTWEDNRDVIKAYLLATECGRLQLGYVRRMHDIWTAMRPDRPVSEGLLADRRRYITKNNKISKVEEDVLRKQMMEERNQRASETSTTMETNSADSADETNCNVTVETDEHAELCTSGSTSSTSMGDLSEVTPATQATLLLSSTPTGLNAGAALALTPPEQGDSLQPATAVLVTTDTSSDNLVQGPGMPSQSSTDLTHPQDGETDAMDALNTDTTNALSEAYLRWRNVPTSERPRLPVPRHVPQRKLDQVTSLVNKAIPGVINTTSKNKDLQMEDLNCFNSICCCSMFLDQMWHFLV